MLQAYLNYPNSRVSIHGDAECREIEKMQKPEQRRVNIDRQSVERELARFKEAHDFASTAPLNDMWVIVDLGSEHEEQRVLERIKAALDARYVPFRHASLKRHC